MHNDTFDVSPEDLAIAASIRTWLENRQSNRTAWKKVTNLASAFGTKRLTGGVKRRMAEALGAAGITLNPPLEDLGRLDTVTFELESPEPEGQFETDVDTGFSDQLPGQIIAWHQQNIAEEAFSDDEPDAGEYLRCLKSTPWGARQFVWEGSSDRGIVGVVTFGDHLRNVGPVYEKWGAFTPLPSPISRAKLLAHPATRKRFDGNGIRALQGSPIHLNESEARAIMDMIGGLEPTLIPWGDPDEQDEMHHWSRPSSLPAEAFAEVGIHETPQLWRALGLKGQPCRQIHMGPYGRADLVWENTVIEVKKSVTTMNGPGQIERYLECLSGNLGLGADEVRGILIQQELTVPAGLRDRLAQSQYPIELWSVRKEADGRWHVRRLI